MASPKSPRSIVVGYLRYNLLEKMRRAHLVIDNFRAACMLFAQLYQMEDQFTLCAAKFHLSLSFVASRPTLCVRVIIRVLSFQNIMVC